MMILLISGRPPDPRGKGDAKIASCVSETLASGGHTVVHAVPGPTIAIGKTLNAMGALVCGEPLQVGVTRSRGLSREVKRILQMGEIALTIAVHTRTAQYVPSDLRSHSIAFLYDSCALAYATYAGRLPRWMDSVFRLEQRRMVTYERTIIEQFGRVAVLAPPDLHYLRSLTLRPASVVRVPYPVDVPYFSQTVRRPVTDPPLFTFVGRLGYIPNQDAVRQLVTRVWPALRARWPRARLRVVGARPGRSLRALLAAHQVELAADVDDVRKELEEATAVLVPMRMGTGVQTKVLEAIAAGVPVICSSFANAGLCANNEEHLLIADTPEQYVAQAERLVADTALTERRVAAARTWVLAQHGPAVFRASFMAICNDLARQPLPVSRPLITSQNLTAG